MQKKNNSIERKQYLRRIKFNKIAVLSTQILLLISFIALWEILANKGIIDSFITSQPSRMLETFMNLSQNGLLEHLGVTCFETIVGFLLGTSLILSDSANNLQTLSKNFFEPSIPFGSQGLALSIGPINIS